MAVRLKRDGDGFPPVDVEQIWCARSGEYYRVDSIPFFAPSLALGDVVEAMPDEDGKMWVRGVVVESGHATVWVVCSLGPDDQAGARQLFSDLGCPSEGSHIPGYFAVTVPPDVDREAVRAALDAGCVAERWDYAEGVAI